MAAGQANESYRKLYTALFMWSYMSLSFLRTADVISNIARSQELKMATLPGTWLPTIWFCEARNHVLKVWSAGGCGVPERSLAHHRVRYSSR